MVDAVADLFVAGETDANRPCGISGCSTSQAAVSMMTATPALSSAPNSVVPSVVMIVRPRRAASSGFSAARMTAARSPGNRFASGIIANHLRIDAGGGRFRRRVEMGIEGNGAGRARDRGGNRGQHNAKRILRWHPSVRLPAVRPPAVAPVPIDLVNWDSNRPLRGPWCRCEHSSRNARVNARNSWREDDREEWKTMPADGRANRPIFAGARSFGRLDRKSAVWIEIARAC